MSWRAHMACGRRRNMMSRVKGLNETMIGAASCRSEPSRGFAWPGFKPNCCLPLLLQPSHYYLISSIFIFTFTSYASLSRVSHLPSHHHSFKSPIFLLSPRASNVSLPSASFWSKLKPGGGKNLKEADIRQQQQQQMALSRQRLLTLVYGDMETVRMVSVFH
jgi:hypothetical protein